jgi:hypothetical protein
MRTRICRELRYFAGLAPLARVEQGVGDGSANWYVLQPRYMCMRAGDGGGLSARRDCSGWQYFTSLYG